VTTLNVAGQNDQQHNVENIKVDCLFRLQRDDSMDKIEYPTDYNRSDEFFGCGRPAQE